MKHLHSFILMAAATITAPLSHVFADENVAVLLEPTWQAGKTYTCEHTQDIVISIGAGEQVVENPINVALTFEASVEAHGEEGGKAVRFKTTKARMSMTMLGAVSEYDSEDESKRSPDVAGMIAGVLETDDLKAIYDRNDTFVKFEDGGRSNLKGSGGGAAALAPVKFGRNEIRQLLSYCVREFPDHPVKKGDTWQEENNVNLNLGSADMKMEMTAEGNDNENHPVVTYASDFEVDFAEGGPASGGKGDGKLVGKMTCDAKRAIISDHITTIEMTLSMNGLLMPVRQESRTKVIKIE